MTKVWTVQRKISGSSFKGYEGKGGIAVFSSLENAMRFIELENAHSRIGELQLMERVNEDFTIYFEVLKLFVETSYFYWGIHETEIDLYVKATK